MRARVSEDHLTVMKARWHAAGEQRSNRACGLVAV
jgi:hypothetical protein